MSYHITNPPLPKVGFRPVSCRNIKLFSAFSHTAHTPAYHHLKSSFQKNHSLLLYPIVECFSRENHITMIIYPGLEHRHFYGSESSRYSAHDFRTKIQLFKTGHGQHESVFEYIGGYDDPHPAAAAFRISPHRWCA